MLLWINYRRTVIRNVVNRLNTTSLEMLQGDIMGANCRETAMWSLFEHEFKKNQSVTLRLDS